MRKRLVAWVSLALLILLVPCLGQLSTVTVAKGQIVPEFLVTLASKSVVPNSISTSAGPFILRIENRSHVNNVTLSMTGAGGNGELVRSNHSLTSPDNTFLLSLLPGTYTFKTIGGGGPWALTITVK
jgi:hypothetical protein